MESFYLLIPLALIIVVIAIKLLFWAINNGQYEDLDTESRRILFDETPSKSETKMTVSSPSSSLPQKAKPLSSDTPNSKH